MTAKDIKFEDDEDEDEDYDKDDEDGDDENGNGDDDDDEYDGDDDLNDSGIRQMDLSAAQEDDNISADELKA